jgi:hypothetical protein
MNSVSFYRKLGWRFMESATYRDKEVSIMAYSNIALEL